MRFGMVVFSAEFPLTVGAFDRQNSSPAHITGPEPGSGAVHHSFSSSLRLEFRIIVTHLLLHSALIPARSAGLSLSPSRVERQL